MGIVYKLYFILLRRHSFVLSRSSVTYEKKVFVGGYLYMGEVDKPVNGRDQWIIEVYQIRIGEGTDRIKQCDG